MIWDALGITACLVLLWVYRNLPRGGPPYKRIDEPRWLAHGGGVRRER
jgi:hypothetical protein